MPDGVDLADDVVLVQAFNVLVLMRGEDNDRLALPNFSAGVCKVPDPGVGLTAIPNSDTAICFQSRLWVPSDRDMVAVSDYMDYTAYDPAAHSFRINQGTDDVITAAIPFSETAIVFLKTKSVYLLSNLAPDDSGEYSSAVLTEITREYGCRSPKAVVNVGSDVWFLSDQRGVCSIKQTSDGKVQGVDVPVSWLIEPLIKEINWAYAANARMAYADNKVYVAVPVGEPFLEGPEVTLPATHVGATTDITVHAGRRYVWVPGANESGMTNGEATYTVETEFIADEDVVTMAGTIASDVTATLTEVYRGFANRILVYDTLAQAWAGYDESPGLAVKEMVKLGVGNQTKLYLVSVDGFVYRYEDGTRDAAGSQDGTVAWSEIASSVTTRGFDCEKAGVKRWREIQLEAGTWNPAYAVTGLYDGVNEEVAVGSVTKDRTLYDRPFSAAAYDITNTGDDHDTPYRQDYSVLPGDGLYTRTNGIAPGLMQRAPERWKLRGRGQAVQIEVTSTKGVLEVFGIGVSADPGPNRAGTHI